MDAKSRVKGERKSGVVGNKDSTVAVKNAI